LGVSGILDLAMRWRRARAIPKSVRLPAESDEAIRLRCIGTREILLAEGALCNVPFEPHVATLPGGVPASSGRRAMTFAAYVLSVCALMWFGLITFGREGSIAVVFVFAGLFVGALLLMFTMPTHLRVMPGRLEFRTARPWGKPHVDAVDLRTARLLVDLRQWQVRIEEEHRPKPLEFSIWLTPQRRRLAFLLFLGALSTYDPPTITDDE
jgi:hypothetical protein